MEPGGWEDELAVGKVADAHVDADDVVVIFSWLLFLSLWFVRRGIGKMVVREGLGLG